MRTSVRLLLAACLTLAVSPVLYADTVAPAPAAAPEPVAPSVAERLATLVSPLPPADDAFSQSWQAPYASLQKLDATLVEKRTQAIALLKDSEAWMKDLPAMHANRAKLQETMQTLASARDTVLIVKDQAGKLTAPADAPTDLVMAWNNTTARLIVQPAERLQINLGVAASVLGQAAHLADADDIHTDSQTTEAMQSTALQLDTDIQSLAQRLQALHKDVLAMLQRKA